MSFTNPVLQATTGCNELITSVVVADALHTSDCRLAEEKKNVKEKETYVKERGTFKSTLK